MKTRMEGGWKTLVLASAAVLAALWPLIDHPARAQDAQPAAAVEKKAEAPEGSAAKGRTAFRIYCASCHGANAKGDGPVGQYLKVRPTDLTRLAAKNKGTFPEERAYAVIDGRDAAAAPVHGPRDMPVWGLSFQVPGKDATQEADVRARIQDLVAFLRSIQESGAK